MDDDGDDYNDHDEHDDSNDDNDDDDEEEEEENDNSNDDNGDDDDDGAEMRGSDENGVWKPVVVPPQSTSWRTSLKRTKLDSELHFQLFPYIVSFSTQG